MLKKFKYAIGNGQSECCICKKEGKYSLTWTSFLYTFINTKSNNLYCYTHAKEIEKGDINGLDF